MQVVLPRRCLSNTITILWHNRKERTTNFYWVRSLAFKLPPEGLREIAEVFSCADNAFEGELAISVQDTHLQLAYSTACRIF